MNNIYIRVGVPTPELMNGYCFMVGIGFSGGSGGLDIAERVHGYVERGKVSCGI